MLHDGQVRGTNEPGLGQGPLLIHLHHECSKTRQTGRPARIGAGNHGSVAIEREEIGKPRGQPHKPLAHRAFRNVGALGSFRNGHPTRHRGRCICNQLYAVDLARQRFDRQHTFQSIALLATRERHLDAPIGRICEA